MRFRFFLAPLALLGLAAIPLSAASICDAVTGNLVTNCGFETGDFTGWSVTGNTGFTGVAAGSPWVNSGNFGTFLGAVGSDTLITQVLPTVAGTVDLSFYLMNLGGTPNDFTVLWNSVDVGPSLVDAGAFGYTKYTFVLAGVGNDSLQFQVRQDPSYWGLDDVVATQSPEPGTIGMLLGGLGLVVAGRLRRRA
jgi:hypothetical protein